MKRIFKHFRYGEKGFTLIELLVVICILGVLAAVVVPNVSRFMGQGKDEAGLTELHSVQTAVTALMADQGIVSLTAPADTTAMQDMDYFPTTLNTDNVSLFVVDGAHFLQKALSEYWYTCESDGTVRGYWLQDMSLEIGIDEAP